MTKSTWEQIESLYNLPKVEKKYVELFRNLKSSQTTYTKAEGNSHHLCSFFLPFDKAKGVIYLGHHIKANDWIPPGGHCEIGETPIDTAIREMHEELQTVITSDILEPWNLSVKPINRPESGCMSHYDVWHLVHIDQQPFDYLKTEYYDAGWFSIKEALTKITKNPDFKSIISRLL